MPLIKIERSFYDIRIYKLATCDCYDGGAYMVIDKDYKILEKIEERKATEL